MSPNPTSGWQARPSARRLRAWRNAQLASLAAALDAAVLAWAGDWGLAMGEPTTCTAAAPCEQPAGWVPLGHGAAGAAWLQAGSEEGLCRQLLGAQAARTSIATQVLGACWFDLRHRLSRCLQLAEPPATGTAPPAVTAWSGAVEARLAFGVRLLAEAGCVASVSGARDADAPANREARRPHGALHGIGEALADLPVPLAIRLNACEIDVGSLQDLGLGDVVRLPHALDLPAAVVDGGGNFLFRGQLARRQGRKAVELVPAPT